MLKQMNYVALTAGVLTLVLIAVSVFVPWWQFSVGSPNIATVNFSPVNFNFAFFNSLLTVPIIWALNIASLLTLLSGGIALLIYALFPHKSYAKSLLSFGYKKPLYAFILFIVELVILYFSATMLSGMSFPLMGSAALSLPTAFVPGGVSISVQVTAGFGWTFYFAIVVVALCIVARFYHRRLEKASVGPVGFAGPASSPMPPSPPPQALVNS
jgi:hypothetical protein